MDWQWSQVRKKVKGVGEQGEKETCARWKENESCESVRWIPPSNYPPWQAAAHRARRFVPEPHTQLSQTLTKGPRPH
jgi:hypothetical protein